ncbi:MAG: hypothetical protein ACMUJM_16725 [bacterium]
MGEYAYRYYNSTLRNTSAIVYIPSAPLPTSGVIRKKLPTYSFEILIKDVILSSLWLKNPKDKIEQKIAHHNFDFPIWMDIFII